MAMATRTLISKLASSISFPASSSFTRAQPILFRSSFLLRLRPVSTASPLLLLRLPAAAAPRSFSTRPSTSSLNDPPPTGATAPRRRRSSSTAVTSSTGSSSSSPQSRTSPATRSSTPTSRPLPRSSAARKKLENQFIQSQQSITLLLDALCPRSYLTRLKLCRRSVGYFLIHTWMLRTKTMEENRSLMEKLCLMTRNTTRSGSETMHGLMRGQGVMTGLAILIVQGTSRGGEKTCKTVTSKTERVLQCLIKGSKIRCHHIIQHLRLHHLM
ncbi:multiple organellar RNA editing factor 8, chloroplastic/mitochondrial-like [Iris pallida]|uniref:Multiple organellar RNA editing factor 8, chloroplastic/mitochondrial-like n=1 Tax=Iris pallida TaxID=29817 RepID=A0AAX6HN13_IRIPA|nr:multiple organellar RNA editing factor 8, chloroplastic/mitochondrial-like [Iris pallida]